jgi:hypothetical protein
MQKEKRSRSIIFQLEMLPMSLLLLFIPLNKMPVLFSGCF